MAEMDAIVRETPGADATELSLMTKNRELETQSHEIIVETDEQYAAAAEFARDIKTQQKTVAGYFKPLKDAANQTHKLLCARENDFMRPLKAAEDACKAAMTAYTRRKQEEARRQQEEMQRLAREEAARKLAEAEAAEKKGDDEAVQSCMQQAIVADQLSATAYVAPTAPKVSGVSQKTDWEIVDINPDLVPIDLNGVVIRPVDQKAVMNLIRATKGQIKIPGITYRETVNLSVNSRRS